MIQGCTYVTWDVTILWHRYVQMRGFKGHNYQFDLANTPNTYRDPGFVCFLDTLYGGCMLSQHLVPFKSVHSILLNAANKVVLWQSSPVDPHFAIHPDSW